MEKRQAGKLDKGGRPKKTGSPKDPVSTLAAQGVDKHLAGRLSLAQGSPLARRDFGGAASLCFWAMFMK